MSSAPLKLSAKDSEDICIVSAVLQDSIVPVCDMVWQPEDQSFILVPQRLRRENGDQTKPDRICCAVHVRGVEAAQTHGLDLTDQERMLDLLMLSLDGSTLHFIFADHVEIRLKLGTWSLIVEDFGESWPTACTPCHESSTASRT